MKLLTSALCAGLAVGGLVHQARAADDVKVGIMMSFSGVYASVGDEMEDAFLLGIETFRDEVPDVEFTFVREDTEVKPPVGLAKARKLILQDEVDVIVGISSSGVLGAIRNFVHDAKVPLIVTNAGNDDATGAQCSPYIARLSFSNRQVNRPMGQWLYDHGVRTIYTMAPDYAAGRQMIDAFVEGFREAGGEVVGQEFTPFGATKDFAPYLARARASGADGVYAFYAGGEAISFVKQYDSFGLKSDVPLYGPGFLTSQLYVDAQGRAAEGVVTGLHYVPALDNDANKAFVKAYHEETGRMPSEYAVHAFDAARMLVEILKTGARDRASIAEAFAQISFDGPRGRVSVDPATNNIVQPIHVYETIVGEGGMTQRVLATLPSQQDPPNGCSL